MWSRATAIDLTMAWTSSPASRPIFSMTRRVMRARNSAPPIWTWTITPGPVPGTMPEIILARMFCAESGSVAASSRVDLGG